MSKETIKQVIQEKYGFVTNMENLKNGKGYPTEGKHPQKSAHPLENFRNFIKLALGSTTSEQDEQIEHLLDIQAVIRLASKYALHADVINNLKNIKAEFDKPKTKRDLKIVVDLWDNTKRKIPYWFLTLMPKNREPMEEQEKLEITNLLNYMAYFNKESEKAGKENAKNTEHADRDTAAKDNLNKARKGAGMDTDAASEKNLKEKPDQVKPEIDAKATAPKVPEKIKDITAVVIN